MSVYRSRSDYAGHTIHLMLALALVGIGIAFYDSYVIYNGLQLWCPPPIDGCNTVAYSPYARISGVPIGYLGLAYYAAMFGIAAWLSREPFSPELRWVALLYAAAGLCASIYFFYVQRTYIQAFCVYCLISAVVTVFLFGGALRHFRATRADGARPPSEKAVSAA